ncbi:MAG: heavy metal translocating P-type ATPase [Burkholderiales bacterium]|nr:heavy metal translocating P-type ATPase [Burkholderiales bacterium]
MTAVTPASGSGHPAQDAGCFHCGLPLDAAAFPVTLDGVAHDTCCRGCQAVAQTIVDNGLGAYYRNRTALAPSVRNAGIPAELGAYDLPEVQRNFVRDAPAAAHEKEASLLIDGVTCAACVWLIEQRLARLPGVTAVSLNYATRRARVRWDTQVTALSTILRAVADLGYTAHPYDSGRAEERLRRERSVLLWRLFIAGFSMMQVMMYAIPVYIAGGAMTPDIEQLMRIASLVLTLPVALWSAVPFYAGAWRDLRSGRVGMDVPVALGIVIAFAASVAATWSATGEVYFDSVSMFVFLLLGARFLEMAARTRAVQTQEQLVRLVPATAERLVGDGATERVAAASLKPDDLVRVRPGGAIPADGVVVDGITTADESLLTGESRPVAKRPGDLLTGGAVNLDGVLTMRVTRVGEDTALAGIVRLMDRAQTEKPRIALAADRVARWFVAILLVLTAGTFAVWWQIDPARALWVAVAMLVVTCPCALSLATPAALTAATGAAYRAGVLVTRGTALETLARATHFVFDKTGTLTSGRMALAGVTLLAAETQEQSLAYGAALESWSEHPVGRALVAAAHGVHPVAGDVRTVTAQGVEGRVAGRLLRIGKPPFVAELHHQPLPPALDGVPDAVSVVALGDERGWIALFMLDDVVRHDAPAMIRTLAAEGLKLALLSGDRPQRAAHTAIELGITEFRGGATPADKLAYVRELQTAGAVVAMIGDGVNDAPVLAQAQVSIALGGGTELAQISADIILMADRLDTLAATVRASRHTLRVIHQNLAWAVAYNAVALPLAMAGMVTPLVAAIGMSASSLLVVANALRLMRPAVAGTSAVRQR